MSSIGSLTVTSWRGVVQAPAPEAALVTRPGVAGALLLVGAAHPREQQIVTDVVGNAATVGAAVTAADGMVGTVVSATDPFGRVWSATAVLGVVHDELRMTTAGWLLRSRWSLALDVAP